MSDVTTSPDSQKASLSPNKKMAIVSLLLIVVVVVAVILSVNSFRSTLNNAKTGKAIGSQSVPDGILAQGTINKVDPVAKTMNLSLEMVPQGTLDQGGGILATPVTLYYDSSEGGTKQLDFKADKPLGSTDLTIPLGGSDVGSYPWDKYQTNIELLFVATVNETSPASGQAPSGSQPTETAGGGSTSSSSSGSGSSSQATIPVDLTIKRNVPSYSVVEADGSQDSSTGLITATIKIKRAGSALFFSMLVTVIMWGLALAVTFVALSVLTRRRKLELPLFTVVAAILFAMPAALRSFQPGIPAPGVLSDFYGFIPCDVLVAFSLIALIATYLIRRPA